MRGDHGHRGRHQKEECRNKDGAQTFRRGRALAFLEKLTGNRDTLLRQLNDPNFEAIKPVISGELKATESIMEDFIRVFQLHEIISEDGTALATPREEESGTEDSNSTGSDES